MSERIASDSLLKERCRSARRYLVSTNSMGRFLILCFLLLTSVNGIAESRSGDNAPGTAVALVEAGPIASQILSASSSEDSYPPEGAADGDRFSLDAGKLWKGSAEAQSWYWQADFGRPVEIGTILQVLGDEESVLKSAPLDCIWQVSDDGCQWRGLPETRISNERRLYRIHRLNSPTSARFLRLSIASTGGPPPSVREIEVYSNTNQTISFPDWAFSVSSEDKPVLDSCNRFLDLAHQCQGWNELKGQYVWHGHFGPDIALAEPRPLCAFFTGSHRDWCEVDPSTWRGTQELLKHSSLPIWAACGGCQAFAILEEHGCDQEWDCPNCRDPDNPKSPIYGHIGLIDPAKKTACGIYTNNVYEIGPTRVRRIADDPVFRGLPDDFLVPEYHCGQIEYLPAAWDLIVTRGKGGKTWMQCMRKRDSCIYAAQFHIELQGTPEVSQTIMTNFLNVAKQWSQDHIEREVRALGTNRRASPRSVSELASQL